MTLGTLEVKVSKSIQYIHNVYTQYTNTQPEILFCIFKIKVENQQKKIPKNCVAHLVRNVCPIGAWNFYGRLMTVLWFNPSRVFSLLSTISPTIPKDFSMKIFYEIIKDSVGFVLQGDLFCPVGSFIALRISLGKRSNLESRIKLN